MKTFKFITRHAPTTEQLAIAASREIVLECVGDRDAFTFDPSEFDGNHVIVVHPWMALQLTKWAASVSVWENESRSVEGGNPTFHAKELHTMPSAWWLREEFERGAM